MPFYMKEVMDLIEMDLKYKNKMISKVLIFIQCRCTPKLYLIFSAALRE